MSFNIFSAIGAAAVSVMVTHGLVGTDDDRRKAVKSLYSQEYMLKSARFHQALGRADAIPTTAGLNLLGEGPSSV